MNDILNSSGLETLSQLSSTKNGTIIVGVLAVAAMVIIPILADKGYRFSGTGQGDYIIEPARETNDLDES